MSYMNQAATYSMAGGIQTLSASEIDLICGGTVTQALRDIGATAAVVGTVATVAGAEPVAVGAFLVSAAAFLGAAIIG